MAPVKLFISYAHDDREKWLAPVHQSLQGLETVGLIEIFENGDIKPGEAWGAAIQDHLDAADLVVLLVTRAFLASLYSIKVELNRALQRKAHVVPIIVQPCHYASMPFAGLEALPIGPDKRPKALSSWEDQEEALAQIAARIDERAREISTRKAAAGASIAAPARLPDLAWNFTGRGTELARLHGQLHRTGRSANTPHAITGLGGIGKSQLALAYATRHRGEYDLVRWLPAEEPASLAAAYMALAPALGLPADAPDQAALIAAIREQLESRERFLLVFDNASGPVDLRPYLPRGGKGHVLITSRERHWRGTAQPLELDLLPEEDAVELLTGRTADAGTRAEAKALAEELGFLPLALAQARAYVDELAVDISTYRRRLVDSGRKVRARGLPAGADYPHSVATVWQASIEAAERRCPAARQLLELLAFLAPDAVPRGLLDAEPGLLPEGLREPTEREEAVGALARFSLLGADPAMLSMHRLVQAVTRDGLDEAAAKARAETAIRLVNAALPRPPMEHTDWPAIAALLAHALAAAQAAERLGADLEAAATVLNDTALCHRSRATWSEAEPLFQRAIAIGEKTLGPEHPSLAIRLNNLAILYQDTGRYAEAEPLY
jgi:tetratricopeptide (TPR) repeat protein